jgi:ABC-type transport system involved in multi-copper enzyme maturation permease subunit
MTTSVLDPVRKADSPQQVPLSRVTGVELRKMFDTRSGAWLLASIGIAGVLSTAGTVLLAPHADLSYYTFAKAIGFPMTVLLPVIAVLAITGEWSQRSGLTTFTLVPRRDRVIAAKVLASLTVGVVAMLFALAIGVLGNLLGATLAGTDLRWDVSVVHAGEIVAGSLLCLLTGTMLGILFRSSPVALVGYFVYALLVPTVFQVLASSATWFRHLRPWVDLNLAESWLFEGTLSAQRWGQLATAVALCLVLPGLVGLRLVVRSEVR